MSLSFRRRRPEKENPRADDFSAWGFAVSTKMSIQRPKAGLLARASPFRPHLPEALAYRLRFSGI
jgi:hypothetical protein